jgi:hypothetical protein
MSLAKRLREHLQGLLIEHVKRQQIESKKRKRINELREIIRKRKAASAAEKAAPRVKHWDSVVGFGSNGEFEW